MLEKNSSILITYGERLQLESGILPERLSREWKLSLAEAQAIILNSQVTHVESDSAIPPEAKNVTW